MVYMYRPTFIGFMVQRRFQRARAKTDMKFSVAFLSKGEAGGEKESL
jgi:hypothetical protein